MTRPLIKTPFYAIDPGGPVLGWAFFSEGELISCGLSRPPKTCKTPWDRAVWHRENLHLNHDERIVCERMVHRMVRDPKTGRKRRVRPQDIIDLNLIAGHLGNEWYSSTEWKGDLPREVEQERTEARLTLAEFKRLEAVKPLSLRHNCVSAIGIGLFVAGRGGK